MNAILTMFMIGLLVYDTWRHGFYKFARTTCFFTYIYRLFESSLKPRDTQLHVVIELNIYTLDIHIGCIYKYY